MFTGIVQAVGKIQRLEKSAAGMRLTLAAPSSFLRPLRPGGSVAVSGCCLTVLKKSARLVQFDLAPETLKRTALGSRKPGDALNLEAALRAGGELGGHIMQGHVDALGRVAAVRRLGDSRYVSITYPAALAPFLVEKGSVALDGVSLTVSSLAAKRFEVCLIPYTLRHSTLGALKPGAAVNLEVDILGKFVLRALETSGVLKRRR